jgi:hypothetical protein
MSNFVMGALVVQLLGGLYLLSFTADAGVPESTARRTRLSDPVLLTHPALGLVSVVVWIAWLNTHGDPLPWVALATLGLGALLGGYMGIQTRRPAPDPVAVSPHDPAAARYAEKRIPQPAALAHGALATVILVCVLLVALGVG